jgi:hypothetical protein
MKRVAGLMLAGFVLLGGSTQVDRPTAAGQVVGRVGDITVTASSLHQGPSRALTSELQITTSGQASDQLDVALAPGASAASVYHRQVSVGEISDLASCDGTVPPTAVVNRWLHYGPLLVPGRSYGKAAPASATLSIPSTGIPGTTPSTGVPSAGVSAQRSVAITLYFAHAGQVTLDLPVRRA